MKYSKIALIGMMGSGKSTIGRMLSQKVNYNFADSDDLFEKENNIKIAEFFKNFGEELFRKKETEILKRIGKSEKIILSTGGGIVLKEENRNILFNKDIYTVYLSANPEAIFDRIKNDNTRPLLLVENPQREIEKILKQRIKFYNLANLTIQTDNKTKEEVTDEIWKKLI